MHDVQHDAFTGEQDTAGQCTHHLTLLNTGLAFHKTGTITAQPNSQGHY